MPFDEVDEKLALTVCIVRLWRMLNDTGTPSVVFSERPPRAGRTLRFSFSPWRNCSCAVMLTLVPCCAAPRPPRPPARPPPPPNAPPPRPAAAPPPPADPAAATAAAAPRAGRRGREVVRHAQAHVVGMRLRR